MSIHLLDQDTINKIAAGEVIEGPKAVVKELIENAIDSGANSITAEIKDGGKSLIRITDNGCGINENDIVLAFTPHATSKISDAKDILSVLTLGFRGEALASIASVSQLEMLTKTREAFSGRRYVIEGGEEKRHEEIGCPDGTTFIVRNLFYNTPARLKFLKTAQTEAGYISSVVEHMALSRPDIAFRFLNQNQQKLHTSGNGNLKDVIYNIYGRDTAANLLELNADSEVCSIRGFIGKPVISRGNRSYMIYFINGRFIKSNLIYRAIEEAYAPYTMQHKFPFTVLHFNIEPEFIDINVHPQKMEVRFTNEKELYTSIYNALSEALSKRELIPDVTFDSSRAKKAGDSINIKDVKKVTGNTSYISKDTIAEKKSDEIQMPKSCQKKLETNDISVSKDLQQPTVNDRSVSGNLQPVVNDRSVSENLQSAIRDIGDVALFIPSKEDMQCLFGRRDREQSQKEDALNNMLVQEGSLNEIADYNIKNVKQENLFEDNFLSEQAHLDIKIIGQVFSTYWILQYNDSMYMIDQHAAHEKVLYERFMKQLAKNEPMVQMVEPPVVLSLSMTLQQSLEENMDIFERLGYRIENFGGREYMVSGVPANLPNVAADELIIEIIDELSKEKINKTPEILLERVATMSCKAAVKGGNDIATEQMHELLKELMTLDNPYNCPHGRPTMIRMTKRELEKKFKRIV